MKKLIVNRFTGKQREAGNFERASLDQDELERKVAAVGGRCYSINFDTWLQLLFKILAIAFERLRIRLQLAERH